MTYWTVKKIGETFPTLLTADEEEATNMVRDLNQPHTGGGWVKMKVDDDWIDERINYLTAWCATIQEEITKLEVFSNEHRDTGTDRT